MHQDSGDSLGARRAHLEQHIVAALGSAHGFAVVLLDDRGVILDWNKGAEQVLGYSTSEAVGQTADIFFVPEDRHRNVPQQELATAALAGVAADDRWHIRRDGSRFFGSGIVTPCRDESGALLGFVKIFRDLTSERRAQEQLTASEDRYRLLVNSIRDYAIFMLDADGMVSYWTEAAQRIKGYTSDEIIGQPFATFFTQPDRDQGIPERELRTAREHGSAEGCGWRVRKDGSLFWADEIATAVYDHSGTHIGYSKITRDSTERRALELERERLLREATDSNKLKDDFLSTISHELRTPLNAILGWVQLMRLREPDATSLPEALTVIERNARAQARLIEDLLDVSRIVTGTTDLTMAPISFAEPLAAAVDTVRLAAEQKTVRLVVQHTIAHDELMGDAVRLQQVLWNLLTNAIKFTPAGGTVDLSTVERPDAIELRIVDTGIGIDRAFLPHVFDRFRQGDTSSTREHHGLGLGLAIAKHLVDLHRGQIVVESDGPGTGTTVRVTLPRSRPLGGDAYRVEVQHRAVTSADHSLNNFPVLVIDDDLDTRKYVELALSMHGARIFGAQSVAEGLAAVRSLRPAVILSDLSMPLQDGYDLLEQVRADPALRTTPIVAISAHARPEDRERAMAAGFDAYLPKPATVSQIVGVVRRMIARHSDSGTTPTS